MTRMTPLITNPRFMRVAAPFAIGVLLLLAWQLVCTALAVPVYLVPAPSVIARTLVSDWGLLSEALLVTLQITFMAFVLAVLLGVAIAFVFVQRDRKSVV